MVPFWDGGQPATVLSPLPGLCWVGVSPFAEKLVNRRLGFEGAASSHADSYFLRIPARLKPRPFKATPPERLFGEL